MAEKRKDKDGRVLPENVTQRKDGTYMWRKSVNGKNYCLYAKTLGEIKQKRNIALGEIEKGEYKGKHEKMKEERESAQKDITLNEWFFQWEKVYRKGKMKETTVYNNHIAYMHHFSNNIGRMKIKDIRQMDITKLLNQGHKNGLAYATLESNMLILKLVFDSAISNGLIEKNPACGSLVVKKNPPKERRALTEEEENRFIEFVRNDRYQNGRTPFFIIGFGTGLRLGELLGLTWSDIDFENNVIHVNKNFVTVGKLEGKYVRMITTPKTKSSIRDVPMLGKVREAFEEQKRRQYKCKEIINGITDFVFTTKNGKIICADSIRIGLNRIIEKMNKKEIEEAKAEGREAILFKHFSPHCMRHTFATRCYEKGVKEKVIQNILGHSKLDVTLNIYTHITDEMITDDMKKLEE